MNHRFKKKKNHFSFFAYIFLSAGQDYGKKCRETLSCQESKNVLSEEAPQKTFMQTFLRYLPCLKTTKGLCVNECSDLNIICSYEWSKLS